jgi:hypothetical protein
VKYLSEKLYVCIVSKRETEKLKQNKTKQKLGQQFCISIALLKMRLTIS